MNVASHLISFNENRLGKKLNSNKDEVENIKLNCFRNGKVEAIGVADIIEIELKKKYSYNDWLLIALDSLSKERREQLLFNGFVWE